MEALERLMEGRTVITIAHRLSTIRDADKIIVIENGCVAEQGTHEELMEKGEIYADLYNVQNWTGHPLHKPV
jgi:ABC-type multidrug transport system fused ATPase/permease subunit